MPVAFTLSFWMAWQLLGALRLLQNRALRVENEYPNENGDVSRKGFAGYGYASISGTHSALQTPVLLGFCNGLQIRLRRFDSDLGLHYK